jgi:hypothetical protein
MYSFLLKKALPFTLTFIFGAALAALVGLFGASEKKSESFVGTRTYDYANHCRMRRHNLVAESKPLNIINVPAARWPREVGKSMRERFGPVRLRVTFGADGKVQEVELPQELLVGSPDWPRVRVWDASREAARGIRFEPETVNSVPITVTREVEINFDND